MKLRITFSKCEFFKIFAKSPLVGDRLITMPLLARKTKRTRKIDVHHAPNYIRTNYLVFKRLKPPHILDSAASVTFDIKLNIKIHLWYYKIWVFIFLSSHAKCCDLFLFSLTYCLLFILFYSASETSKWDKGSIPKLEWTELYGAFGFKIDDGHRWKAQVWL
jgi:hypothetical protein